METLAWVRSHSDVHLAMLEVVLFSLPTRSFPR